MRTKKEKKIKAWLIIDRQKRYPYSAYVVRDEALNETKKEHAGFHKNDVVVPCNIIYQLTDKK